MWTSVPPATAKFHVPQHTHTYTHTQNRNHWTQYKFRVPGACVSIRKGRFQLEFPGTWNSRSPRLFWGWQKAHRASGDITSPGVVLKVQLWSVKLLTLIALEHMSILKLQKDLSWLERSGEGTPRLPWCNGGKDWGLGLSCNFCASFHPQKRAITRQEKKNNNKQKEPQGQTGNVITWCRSYLHLVPHYSGPQTF